MTHQTTCLNLDWPWQNKEPNVCKISKISLLPLENKFELNFCLTAENKNQDVKLHQTTCMNFEISHDIKLQNFETSKLAMT